MPWGIDFIFSGEAGSEDTTIPVRQRFRQACVFHDLCYRHGLATYGYTQNDCDELLQEQALRICVNANSKSSVKRRLDDCQLDAKKVAAGVKVGGFKAYQGWGNSTHFEFDPNPYRSIQHSAVRTLDHPFKRRFSDTLSNEPIQLLVDFKILRGGVRFSCLNCPPRVFSADEWLFVGDPNASGMLKDHKMNEEGVVWIPSGRLFSAPHVVRDGEGRQALVWLVRQTFGNSLLCVVVAEPGKVLTDTKPSDAGCVKAVNGRMALGQVDLLSSAPQVAIVAPQSGSPPQAASAIVGTGLTNQVGDLAVCVSQDMRNGQSSDEKRCHKLIDANGKSIAGLKGLGAFQNFAIVKGARHIYFLRHVATADTRNESDEAIRLLVVDIATEHMPKKGSSAPSGPAKLAVEKTFAIKDDFDPMVPVSFDPADLRIMSTQVPASRLARRLGLVSSTMTFYEADLASANPGLVKVPVQVPTGTGTIDLHESWAGRPILITETAPEETGKKTQIILSRSRMQVHGEDPKKIPGGNVAQFDETQFEFAVLERSAAAAQAGAPFRIVRGLTCTITYTVNRPDDDRVSPCARVAPVVGTHRATPATMLQGAQLLAGRFTNRNDSQLALIDRCIQSSPIIIQPVEIGASAASEPASVGRNLQRDARCQPIANSARLAEPM